MLRAVPVERLDRAHCRVLGLLEEGIDVGVRLAGLPDSSLVAVPVGQTRRDRRRPARLLAGSVRSLADRVVPRRRSRIAPPPN